VASGILLFHQDVVTVASAAGGDAGDRPAEAAPRTNGRGLAWSSIAVWCLAIVAGRLMAYF